MKLKKIFIPYFWRGGVPPDSVENSIFFFKNFIEPFPYTLLKSEPSKLPSQPTSAWFDFTMSNTCPECGKEFSSDLSMKIHYKTQHSGVTYPCNKCEYVSKVKAQLDKHLKNVHELQQCKDCSFKIVGKRSLWLHTKSKHIQTRKHKK